MNPDFGAANDASGEGLRIGPYRIVKPLGRGGQATVYLAEHSRLRNRVALKVVDPAVMDHHTIDRFRRTAEITARLDHPGICAVFDTGEDHGSHWIAMRYVEGESLADKIVRSRAGEGSVAASTFVVIPEHASAADAATTGGAAIETGGEASPAPARAGRVAATGPIPAADSTGQVNWIEIGRVLVLFEGAARALHAAHEKGVVHRDVKPGNIMVAMDGSPVIVDFGLAQDLEGDQPTLTLTGSLMGTPDYMSPEQMAAQRIRLDRRTDVYSLGVSLFECLTLRRPFESPTREGLYQAILTKEPPDPRRLNPSIPADLRVVVATALEKDRDRRYQTALDLAEDLRRVRMREPIVAKPVGSLVRLQRWAQRNPALATAVGALFAVLAIGLVVSLFLLARADRERVAKDRALEEKTAALDAFERLGDQSRLERLLVEARDLWPGRPEDSALLDAWVARAESLMARLPLHEGALGGPPASEADQFKHDTTARLVGEMRAFADPDRAKGVLAAVRWRLEVARTAASDARWAEAIGSIADSSSCPEYRGLRIKPQRALVPIARDPASGLWEFLHVPTARPGVDPIPARDANGRLAVTGSTGVVLVLLPGGTFRMGSVKAPQGRQLTEPNVDPDADEGESPVHDVTLDAFYLSKYEMTQGQWLRATGTNPSEHGAEGDRGLRLPIEMISWEDCRAQLPRAGLSLPTEAQWEYAARAGTTTPRWTGIGEDGLAPAARIARLDPDGRKLVPAPAPGAVGLLSPNPFGFHDILGNVHEWCHDGLEPYSSPVAAGNGLRGGAEAGAAGLAPFRGGSFRSAAVAARSAFRGRASGEVRDPALGVRPARALDRD